MPPCCLRDALYADVALRAHVLTDPTAFEEPLLDTTITVTVDDNGDLISVTQLGISLVGNQDALGGCIAAAKARHAELRGKIYHPS